jgi:hypothetical protein
MLAAEVLAKYENMGGGEITIFFRVIIIPAPWEVGKKHTSVRDCPLSTVALSMPQSCDFKLWILAFKVLFTALDARDVNVVKFMCHIRPALSENLTWQ